MELQMEAVTKSYKNKQVLKGSILYNGKEIHAVGDEYRAKIGYLPQDISFYGDFTGRDYLEYSAALKGMEKAHAKKRMVNAEENQRVFEDTQPAIIERGQWERVQELRTNKRRPTKTGKTSTFSGLVYCVDCGAKLYYCTCNTYKDGLQDHFVCPNYKGNTGS